MPELMPPQIGRYRVQAELGRGGFGRVYRALDPSVGRLVAVKVLTAAGKDVLRRFRNEASVAANLRHENIVTVYEFGEHADSPFLAMEYLEGDDLHQIIAAHKPLSILEKCKIMLQVAEGLDYAHRNGVIHRDVKPANIMVLPGGRVKIMDFGVARLTQDLDATRLTQEGSVVGTVLYMAPEQLSGSDANARGDTFAYGVTFFELLTGRHPFEATDPRALMYKISFEEPPPLRDFLTDCPEALQRVISRLLQKDPELRYQSLREVHFDIDPIRIELQQESAAKLLLQAQELVAGRQLEQAQSLVLEVLSLDPANRVARLLREDLQRQLQLLALQPRIESLLKSGEEQQIQRRFAEAVQSFETAMRLDPQNINIQSRAEHARGLLEHFNKARGLFDQARRQFEQQDLAAAHKSASEALQHDPHHPEAAVLLETIERATERLRRERMIEEAIGEAEAFGVAGAYDDAIRVLDGLVGDLNVPRVERLRSRIREEQERREKLKRVKTQIDMATGLLRAQRLEEAVSFLETLRSEFPENEEVLRLLSYGRAELESQARVQLVHQAVAEANSLTEARNFDAALAVLDRALNKYPGEGLLTRSLGSVMAAKAQWDRQNAIQSAISECERLRSQKRFGEALQLAESALVEYGVEPKLVELIQQLEKQWDQQRRREAVEKAVEDAKSLLNKNQPEQAVRLIQQACAQYSDEADLLALLARAKEELRVYERTRAIDAIVREAAVHAEAKKFQRALTVLENGLKTWPEDELLIRQQAEIEQARNIWKRQKTIAETRLLAKQFLLENQLTKALTLISSVLEVFPGDPELLELSAHYQKEQAELERQQAVQQASKEARLLLSNDRLDDAVSLLDRITQQYPGELELESLLSRVKEKRSKREKAEAISKLVTDVNRLKETREFGRAFEVLNQGLREHPGDPTLVREFESLRTARAIWLRQQAVGEILARVQQLKSEIRFADASKLLVESLKEYRDEPVLLDAQQQLEKEWSAHKRRDDIAKSAADAASMLASGQLKEAVQFLRAACEKYPDELEIQALFVRATEALREQGRSEAVSKVEQRASALADRHEFEAALQLLEVELKKWPGEKRLLSAQARIQGQEKTEQYQKVLRQADALIGRGQFKEALRNLDAALEQYAGDAALGQLRERAKREQELQERAEAVAAVLTQIKALTDQARLDEALQLARESCRKYPGEAALESALDRVQQELRAIKQRQQAERECETLMGEGRFQEAINLLQAAVASFPSDPTLGVLLSKARSELEAGNRAATIAKLVADARTLATGHNYDGAMALLLRGLSSWPSERSLLDAQQEIRSAQASWRLEQAVREKLRSIKRLERDGRFAEALRILEETLQRYPDQTALLELRPQLLKAKCVREAGELLERGQFSGALNLLAPMASQFPSDPELAELVDRAKQGVRAGEKAAAIEKLCSEARGRAEAHDFESALVALNDSLKTWPNESAILETERSIIHLRERWLHQQAVSEAVLQVEQLERENRLDEALECITKSIEDLGSDSAFVQAKERYEAKLQDREWKRRRQSHIEKLSTLDQAASEVSGPSEARQMLEHAHRILEYYPDDQEVRSAGEVSVRHLSDIIRAAGELANRNFAVVLEICDKYLKRFPSHVLCAELRTEARNCVRVEYINQLQRTVSAEPDFESRKRLLQEGFARYPGDPWITEELRLTLKQLSRVGSLVDKAKAHEAAGEWDRAVDQWKGVLSIYAQYPGIQAAIARAEEQIRRTRDTAVSGWVEQINRQVEAGDLDEAAKQFDRALAEFPEERAILDAGIRLEGLKGRRNQLRELLAEGEAALKNGRYEDGTTKLQQAAQLDNTGATLHKVLNLLLKFARKAAPVDWRAAEQMGGAIVTLNPKAALPDDLSRAIATARTDDTVRDCLLRAGELRMKGQLAAAYAEVDRALAICPDERRLKQLQHSLSEQIRAARQPLIDELRAIEASAQTAANPAEIGEMLARARARREQYGNDPEVIALVDAAERALNARKRQLLVARFASYRGVGGAVATGAIVLVLAILGWRHFSQVQGPALEPVEVTSTPSGAEIKVEDQTCASPPCHFRLSRGDHPLTAQLEGYRPVSRTLHVDPAKSTPVHILLEPFGAVLLVTTNFRSGHVMLNGARAGDLQNGSFERKDLLAGKYKVVISGSEGDASLSFETAPGRLPTIQGRVEAKDADALVVSNMGHSAKLDCNCTSGEVLLDGKRLGNLGAQGLDLRDLSEGNKKLNVRERDVNINIGPEPSINVILTSARNVGTLSVETNVDNATVIVDKKRYPGASAGKSIQLQLDVGNYLVEVQKDGYSGARQSAQITRGSRLQRTFTLAPLSARLDIQGARAGTRVSIDGKQVGAVQSDGRFSTDVGPGEHAILLELQGYHSKSSRHNFEPGKPWSILPADALLGVDEKVVEAKRRADEDNVWNGVRKDSRAALQQFVDQYPNGARAGEAKGLIEGLDRKLSEQRKLDEQRRLDEQAAEKKKGDEEREKKKAEDTRQQQIELARRQTEQRKAEEDAIRLAVGKYETAYQKEDLNGLKAIYPTLQKSAESTIKNNFTYFARFQYTLKPGAPEIQGDTASVQCSRSLTGRTKDGQSLAQNDTVVVRLKKDRDHWLIVSMDTTR